MKKDYASPLGHWALTASRSSANVTLIILRLADLAAASLDGLFDHPAFAAHFCFEGGWRIGCAYLGGVGSSL